MKTKLALMLGLLFIWATPVFADKGAAGPGGCPNVDLSILSQVNVDWFYTWSMCGTSAYTDSGIEYVPMVRSIHDVGPDGIRIMLGYLGTGKYWLVGNEPNNSSQDNLSVQQAVVAYGNIIDMILEEDPTAKIILLGLQSPDYYGIKYLNDFRGAWLSVRGYSVDNVVAGYHFHAYAHPYGTETLDDAINRVKRHILDARGQVSGELWITEWGNYQNVTSGLQVMRQMTKWLDSNVDRYAWFYTGHPSGEWASASLFYPWPNLAVLGAEYSKYVSTPSSTPIPTLTLVPTATPSLMPKPTSTNTATCTATPKPTVIPTVAPVLSASIYRMNDWYGVSDASHFRFSWESHCSYNGQWSFPSIDSWLDRVKGPAIFGVMFHADYNSMSNDLTPDIVYTEIISDGGQVDMYNGKFAGYLLDPCEPVHSCPRYCDPMWIEKVREFILDLGQKFNCDDRVAAIEICTGIDGDMIWEKSSIYNNVLTEKCPNKSSYVEMLIATYREAFPDKPLYLTISNTQNAWVEECAAAGVGQRLTSMLFDGYDFMKYVNGKEELYSRLGILKGCYDNWDVPTSWESYGVLYEEERYFGLLMALSTHPDWIDVYGSWFDENPEIIALASKYVGAKLESASSIFIALRDTAWPNGVPPVYYTQGKRGDWEFWLYRPERMYDDGTGNYYAEDVPGSKSVALLPTPMRTPASADNGWQGVNTGPGGRSWGPNELLLPYDDNVEPSFNRYSLSARRTDQASGNPFMTFRVDNRWWAYDQVPLSEDIKCGVGYTLTLTLIGGNDTVSIDYTDRLGIRSCPVDKSGDGWVRTEIALSDMILNSSFDGNDFRINCNGDGDEIVHMVELSAWSPSILPTATPTVKTIVPQKTNTPLVTSTLVIPTLTSIPSLTPVPSSTSFVVIPPAIDMTPAVDANERDMQRLLVEIQNSNLLRLGILIAAACAGIAITGTIIVVKK